MRHRRAILFTLVAIASLAFVSLQSVGNSGGAPQGAAQDGCTCHSPAPNPATTVDIEGVPGAYVPGETYSVTVSVNGLPAVPAAGQNQGGFAIEIAPAIARFVPTDATTASGGVVGWLTHTGEGNDQRTWTFEMTFLPEATGEATVYVAGNAVNGDGVNAGDGWNQAQLTISRSDEAMEDGNGTGRNATATSEDEGDGTPGFAASAVILAAGVSALAWSRKRSQ